MPAVKRWQNYTGPAGIPGNGERPELTSGSTAGTGTGSDASLPPVAGPG